MNPEQELTQDLAAGLLRLMNERAQLAKDFREKSGLSADEIVLHQRVDNGVVTSWYEQKQKEHDTQ